MTMLLPFPASIHEESPTSGVAQPLTRRYWTYDAATTTWTITSLRLLQSGELVDVPATGEFTLQPVGTAPANARRQMATIGTTTFVY